MKTKHDFFEFEPSAFEVSLWGSFPMRLVDDQRSKLLSAIRFLNEGVASSSLVTRFTPPVQPLAVQQIRRWAHRRRDQAGLYRRHVPGICRGRGALQLHHRTAFRTDGGTDHRTSAMG